MPYTDLLLPYLLTYLLNKENSVDSRRSVKMYRASSTQRQVTASSRRRVGTAPISVRQFSDPCQHHRDLREQCDWSKPAVQNGDVDARHSQSLPTVTAPTTGSRFVPTHGQQELTTFKTSTTSTCITNLKSASNRDIMAGPVAGFCLVILHLYKVLVF